MKKSDTKEDKLIKSEHRKYFKYLVICVIVVALVNFIVLFPVIWGPKLVKSVVLGILPSGEGYGNSLTVRRVGLDSFIVEKVSLKGLPMAPVFDTAVVRYSFKGLLNKEVDSIDVRGLRLYPEHIVESFAMPSLGNAGVRVVKSDPLQGWRISDITAELSEINFEKLNNPNLRKFINDTKIKGVVKISGNNGVYQGGFNGMALGMPLKSDLGYSQEKAAGDLSIDYAVPGIRLPGGEPGRVRAALDYSFSGEKGFAAKVSGKASLSEFAEPVTVEGLISQKKTKLSLSVDNLALSGTNNFISAVLNKGMIPKEIEKLSFSALLSLKGDLMIDGGIPKWSVKANLKEGNLNCTVNKIEMSLVSGRVMMTISGVSDFFKIEQIPLFFESAAVGLIPFGRGFATLLVDERRLLISKASVGFCGGFINLYSLYLTFADLNSGFTIELDNLQAGDFLSFFPQLAGSTAQGSLYGKMPLWIEKGGEVRLGEAFLYSPPGETGNISLANPDVVTDLLATAGVPQITCKNLNTALRNLDYSVLRFDLKSPRKEDGKLYLRLQGESPAGKVKTPVNLNINISGPIERMLNLSIKTAKMNSK